jgi:hypothetical protein
VGEKMFVAGIEIVFGFVVGALLLIAGIVAILKLPGIVWGGLKATNEWLVTRPLGWRLTLFGPLVIGVASHQEWLVVVGVACVAVFGINRVIWEIRTGPPWLRKFCAIAFAILFFIVVGGVTLDWMAKVN